jgi:predicted Kef-type K+ transport protein
MIATTFATFLVCFMLILSLFSNPAIYTTANPGSTSTRVPIITLRNSLAAMTIKFRFHIRIRII